MGAMLLAGLQWIGTNLLGPVLAALGNAFLAARQQDQARADQEALGQATQRATDLGAAVDAAARMEQAGAAPKGPTETRKMLDEGRF